MDEYTYGVFDKDGDVIAANMKLKNALLLVRGIFDDVKAPYPGVTIVREGRIDAKIFNKED